MSTFHAERSLPVRSFDTIIIFPQRAYYSMMRSYIDFGSCFVERWRADLDASSKKLGEWVESGQSATENLTDFILGPAGVNEETVWHAVSALRFSRLRRSLVRNSGRFMSSFGQISIEASSVEQG